MRVFLIWYLYFGFVIVCSICILSVITVFLPSVRPNKKGLFYDKFWQWKPNQIVRTCCLAKDRVRPWSDWKHPRGRPHSTSIHQICQDTGVTATDPVEVGEDRRCWWTITALGEMIWLNVWGRPAIAKFRHRKEPPGLGLGLGLGLGPLWWRTGTERGLGVLMMMMNPIWIWKFE